MGLEMLKRVSGFCLRFSALLFPGKLFLREQLVGKERGTKGQQPLASQVPPALR